VWFWAWKVLPLTCVLRRGRCEQTFWPTASHPHPRLASFQIILFVSSPPQPSGLVRLGSMHGLRKYCISCVGTNIQSRQGHPRSTRSRSPPTNSTFQHHIIMQVQLKSWMAARLEQVWTSAVRYQDGAKWCQNGQWHARRASTSHVAHIVTAHDICACCAWLELAMGQVCGRQSKLATFRGGQCWGRPPSSQKLPVFTLFWYAVSFM